MNSLDQLVNSMVREETLKKALPLAKQLGLESVPEEMYELISLNLNYSGQFTPALYARFQGVKVLLENLSEQTMPKHGHIVKYSNQYALYEESALLLQEGDIRKQNMISCVGGKNINIGELKLRDYGLDMHIGCGGPFEPISEAHIKSLSKFDFYKTTYRFWGQTPCGDGMIYVSVPMKRWFLSV